MPPWKPDSAIQLLAANEAGVRGVNVPTLILLGVAVVALGIAYGVGQILKRRKDASVNPAIVRTFNSRVRAWWMIYTILVATFLIPGTWATVLLFGLISFWALREFITLTPTRMGDHRALFWVLFLFPLVQFVLIGMGQEYYGLYSILIPVYGLLFVPARIAIAGDYKRFLERVAKIQTGLLICVYSLSFAPALLDLDLMTLKPQSAATGSDDLVPIDLEVNEQPVTPEEQWTPWRGSTAGLLFYFILIAQLSDVFHFIWDRMLGSRVIAPAINPGKTWEGLFGGMATTAIAGFALSWVTPFTLWQSACMALVIALMAFAGSMTMSAIKRDRGVKDYGTLVVGHAGVLDRIDSLCFAAPVFYHLTRYFFSDVAMM
jgi:phosphatidate cytidylyltransferase